jgi:hypothetical protein
MYEHKYKNIKIYVRYIIFLLTNTKPKKKKNVLKVISAAFTGK